MKKFAYLFATLLFAGALLAQEGRGPDGQYHDPGTGKAQPDMCDNYDRNPYPCMCNRATSCDPEVDKQHPSGGDPSDNFASRCHTYCRTAAYKCIRKCGS
jgi:hypothetical protein